MQFLGSPCALVDLETTGMSSSADRITEIGVLNWRHGDIPESWESLVNPGTGIPDLISRLTGITAEMVADQPYFDELAAGIWQRLQGCILVAHNARFDFGFLKVALAACGYDYRPKIVCTVKLARALFPHWRRYNLDAVCEAIGYPRGSSHRAMADTQAMFAFLSYAIAHCGEDAVNRAAAQQFKKPSLPAYIAPEVVDQLPERPGVYYFFGEDDSLLYIGKSKQLRSRVKAHFSADHRSGKEMLLAQAVRRIDYRETYGEFGALLLENREIKSRAPIYNRRQRRYRSLWVWTLERTAGGFLKPVLVNRPARGWRIQGDVYGPYRNRSTASKALQALVREHQLCQRAMDIESGQGACFAHQLGQCRGACIGEESRGRHDVRLQLAFAEQKLRVWPFDGPVAIREQNQAGEACFHLVNHWAYLGQASDDAGLWELLQAGEDTAFDIDTYRLIVKCISAGQHPLLPLAPHSDSGFVGSGFDRGGEPEHLVDLWPDTSEIF